jgi:diguanylate cyclase
LGHALGLSIVAEGVEHTEELNALRLMGCDVYQGFIASKALPADDFFAMVMLDRAHHAAAALDV